MTVSRRNHLQSELAICTLYNLRASFNKFTSPVKLCTHISKGSTQTNEAPRMASRQKSISTTRPIFSRTSSDAVVKFTPGGELCRGPPARRWCCAGQIQHNDGAVFVRQAAA